MTLIEKFYHLTPAQRERFSKVTDETALAGFASEHGIELNAEEMRLTLEYLRTGVLPMDDDELDEVAGGMSKSDAEALAKADGRIYMLPSGNLICSCHNRNKWARLLEGSTISSTVGIGVENKMTISVYRDIKCYKCGKTKDMYKHTK